MDQKNGPKVSKIVDNMNENQVLAKKLSMEEEKTKVPSFLQIHEIVGVLLFLNLTPFIVFAFIEFVFI